MLFRQARSAQGPEDSFQSAPAPYQQFADVRDDSAGSASDPPAYEPPTAAPHAGPDHVDYGAYTGGYGAFGWYTDHPVLLGPGHRRRRQVEGIPRSSWPAASRSIGEVDLDTAVDAAHGAAVSIEIATDC